MAAVRAKDTFLRFLTPEEAVRWEGYRSLSFPALVQPKGFRIRKWELVNQEDDTGEYSLYMVGTDVTGERFHHGVCVLIYDVDVNGELSYYDQMLALYCLLRCESGQRKIINAKGYE